MEIKEFLSLSSKYDIENIQVTINEENSVEIKTINDRMKENTTSINTEYKILAKIKDKYVDINTNYLDEEIIKLLLMKRDNIEKSYEESFVTKNIEGTKLPKVDLNTADELSKLLELNNIRKNDFNLIEYIEGYYGISKSTTRIVNTLGIDIETSSVNYILYLNATAKKEEEASIYEDIIYTTKRDDIDIISLAKEVMATAEKSLVKTKIDSNKYKVVLSPDFLSNILYRMSSLFSGEQIRKKLSCFENKLDTKIFSDKITIVEDPLNKDMPAYTLFDEEGTKTSTKKLIDKGTLTSYLYNNKEAKLADCASTGNGYGSISVRNLYIVPGTKSQKELINEVKDGLYIRSYQESGGTTVNPTTGAISVQIYGSIIKDGELTTDFEPCILTSNIFELFSDVVDIGSDLVYKRAITASPSIIVDNVSISSN